MKIVWKTIGVAVHLLIEPAGWYTVNFRQIGGENHFLAAQCQNESFDGSLCLAM